MVELAQTSSDGLPSHVARAIARKLLDLRMAPATQIDPNTMLVVTLHVSRDPGYRNFWYPQVSKGIREGWALNPRFVSGWQQAMYEQYTISLTDPRMSGPLMALYAYFYPAEGVENFWSYNPAWFAKEITKEGSFAIISGPPQTGQMATPLGVGKTDCMLFMFEQIQDMKVEYEELKAEGIRIAEARGAPNRHPERSSTLGQIATEGRRQGGPPAYVPPGSLPSGLLQSDYVHFITNASISKDDPIYPSISLKSRLSDFCLEAILHYLKKGFNVVGIDELGVAYDKRRAMRGSNIAFRQLNTVQRKLNIGQIGVVQQPADQLPQELANMTTTRITKLDKYTAIVDIAGWKKQQRVRNFPGTRIVFATKAFAAVTVDFWPEYMLQYVVDAETVAKEENRPWSDEIMLRSAAKWIIDNRLTQAELDAGKSPALRMDIRFELTSKDPVTGLPPSPQAIARKLAIDYDLDIKEVLAKVQEEIKLMQENERKRRIGPTKAPMKVHPDDSAPPVAADGT